MRVTMILPALTEATSPLFRPIKYSLFPPLGLATLAGYLDPDDEVDLYDEHVERLDLAAMDTPDLLVLQPYITSARRSYEIADHFRTRGAHVVMGGLHVASLPEEAAAHADTVFTGPGEDTWPRFLKEFRDGVAARRYDSTVRTLVDLPPVRRDLTPYPSTGLWDQLAGEGRILHRDWDLYDTRHVVYRPRVMTARQLEDGYSRAYRDFYRWANIWRGSTAQHDLHDRLRHLAYAGGWKKFEPAWDMLIRSRQVVRALPMLERTLAAFGGHKAGATD